MKPRRVPAAATLAALLVVAALLAPGLQAAPPEGSPPLVEIPPFQPPPPPRPAPARITPGDARLRIPPGSEVGIVHRLDLPARPTPLDVFFLVDTSGSQEPSIRGLALGLAQLTRKLAEAGLDAQFGLGEFQDVWADSPGVRYRRRVDIRRPDRVFQYQLERLYTDGGDEPHLTALHQVATGSGFEEGDGAEISSPVNGYSEAIEPGQGATWRPGSLRVVVMITDETFSDMGTGPTRDETVEALRADGARMVGVEICNLEPRGSGANCVESARAAADSQGQPLATQLREQLEDISGATDALAPAGGVDCLDNGSVELKEGHPLVCTLPESEDGDSGVVKMAGPLTRVLTSLVDLQPVTLSLVQPAAFDARIAGQGDYSQVDVKRTNQLSFQTALGCRYDQAGSSGRLRFIARVGPQVVGEAIVDATCGDVIVVPTASAPRAAVVQPVSAPPPAPAPVASPAP
ncbi:MAG TPA: hypothetical protein VM030_07605, partial [Acidimicrobiales bacterium]|nr:hypothetical protein [Acidimicrobiales bacterium]